MFFYFFVSVISNKDNFAYFFVVIINSKEAIPSPLISVLVGGYFLVIRCVVNDAPICI